MCTVGSDWPRCAVLLTDEECVRSLIAIQQRDGLGVEAQPQSHCQDKGSHQLQEGRQRLNTLEIHIAT